jgi:branched-subunit amino acid ABC-type transport system permease component
MIFGVLRCQPRTARSAGRRWQIMAWLGPGPEHFWVAALGSAVVVAGVGAVIERLLFRHLYDREELYQLLFTYALVLVLADVVKIIWGTIDVVSRPLSPSGDHDLRHMVPHYNLFIILLGPVIAGIVVADTARRPHHAQRCSTADAGALGANVAGSTPMFALGASPAGLGGALVTPVKTIVPGMDVEVIVEVFIIVVIGGLGSLWGTFLGAVIFGQVLSFGILLMPRFSIFSVFALMAIILIVRPWGLLGRRLTR